MSADKISDKETYWQGLRDAVKEFDAGGATDVDGKIHSVHLDDIRVL